MSLSWTKLTAYAFSPKGLITIVMNKVQQDVMPSVILIGPAWSRRPWYPLLVDMHAVQSASFITTTVHVPGSSDTTGKGQGPQGIDIPALASSVAYYRQTLENQGFS